MKLNLAKITGILFFPMLGITTALPAHADRGFGGFGFGLVTGAVIGSEIARPYYPYYYPYYPPAVIVQQPVVIAPPPTTVAPSANATNTWYYCEPSRAYYPYVPTCTAPWRAVPAVPPGR